MCQFLRDDILIILLLVGRQVTCQSPLPPDVVAAAPVADSSVASHGQARQVPEPEPVEQEPVNTWRAEAVAVASVFAGEDEEDTEGSDGSGSWEDEADETGEPSEAAQPATSEPLSPAICSSWEHEWEVEDTKPIRPAAATGPPPRRLSKANCFSIK